MDFLKIDQTKCKQDGLCALDCPARVIHFTGKGHFPKLVRGGEAACLRCGHCVAVCPHGALDHAEVPLADCPPLDPQLEISPEQTVQFLRSRRSARRFKDKPVPRETIQRLIEIARYAPTGSNTQLVQWLVIDDKVRIEKIAGRTIDWMRRQLEDPDAEVVPYMPRLVKAWDRGMDSVLRSAPCVVVAMAPIDARNGMVDLTIALSYLDLVSPQLGLATCWAGLLQIGMNADPDLVNMVGIPEGFPFHYPMMVGYSPARYYRMPERRPPEIIWT